MSHATDRCGGHFAASRNAGQQAGNSAPGPVGRPPGTWAASGHIDVDPVRWPDVAAVPRSPIRGAIARLLFARIASRLPLRVTLPSGESFGGGGGDAPVLTMRRPGDFYQRVGAAGLIGFGESYMAGDWDADDLTGLLTVLARQVDSLVPRQLQWLRNAYVRRQPPDEDASETGARRNIQRHYDLSNELFALFLDETMTYSAALFEEDGHGLPAEADLAAAQRRKIDRLLDLTRVGPGTGVLEIGTGWGELAIRAAQRGARVRTVTISAEQRELAIRRVSEAGLAGRVSVELLDYRRVSGQYDAILSVEMIEAVAERYWPQYFAALDRLLAPDGRIGLQAITMPHHRMLATRRTQTWILKYIFPGGLIPSVTSIEDNLAAHTGLRVGRAARLRRPLRPDAAALAGAAAGQATRAGAARLRRGVRADVGALSQLRGSGFPLRLPGCLPVPAGPGPERGGGPGPARGGPGPPRTVCGMTRSVTRARPRAGAAEPAAAGRRAALQGRAAGPDPGLGRQRGGPGRRARPGAAHPAGATPDAVAPGRARDRPGIRDRRARRGR